MIDSYDTLKSPHWSCYVKGISVTHVILTFIPITLQDLKILLSPDSKSSSNLSVSTIDNDRASSQSSNYSEVPINTPTSLILPLYVYDCPLACLVDSYINNLSENSTVGKDIYEDHRFKFDQPIVQEDSVKLKNDDISKDSSESRTEEMDTNENIACVKQHCKALFLVHSKCFTISLFSALHYGSFVHNSDVQFAMDQCEETFFDIDITEYLKVSFNL